MSLGGSERSVGRRLHSDVEKVVELRGVLAPVIHIVAHVLGRLGVAVE